MILYHSSFVVVAQPDLLHSRPNVDFGKGTVLFVVWREWKAMNANPILLQKKYARVVELFAKENNISLEKALDIFYHSELFKLMSEGVSDMHCMSDEYLVQELEEEKNIK